MAEIQFDKTGMTHVVHVDVWFAHGGYVAQSRSWLNNGVLKADNLEELATSIAAVVKELTADEVLAKLKAISLSDR